MTKKHTGDLHCHLNGGFSLGFLKDTAEKNGCLGLYYELERLNAEYLKRTIKQPEEGFAGELIGLIWAQFGLIHKIIQDRKDICDGVIDVVKSSKAKYLEIRTTPKPMAKESREQYLDAFEQGLLIANQTLHKKSAVGLISLDRTMHTADDAVYFIQRIKASPHKVLAGLDISGNPLGKRTLSGAELNKVIHLALDSEIPIAIHIAESNSAIEQQDTDIILSALEEWKSAQPESDTNPLFGKVRFGHCIFLTEQQIDRIAKLRVPIEVCPTCHNKLNWHLEKSPHPLTKIYQDVSDPVVMGTDDEVIFGATAKSELDSLLKFLTNDKQLTRKQIKEHQANFRFSREDYILASFQNALSGLLQIEGILNSLKKNIGEIDQHQFSNGYDKATELLSDLKTAKDAYLESLRTPNINAKQAGFLFNKQCKIAINDAKTILDNELDWGAYLTNILKSIYNALIKPFVSDSNAFFKLARPAADYVDDAEVLLEVASCHFE